MSSIPLLGYNVWWGLKGIQVDRGDLARALNKYGFGTYLPDPPTPQKALRRAIVDWMKDSRASGQLATLDDDDEESGRANKSTRSLIRPINKRTSKHMVFGLVAEDVDFVQLGLRYGTQARIQLEKLTPAERAQREPTLICTTEAEGEIAAEDEARHLTTELCPRWKTYQDLYISGDLSRMMREIIAGIGSICIRREGGLYFVPVSEQAQLEALRDLVEGLPTDGSSEPYLMMIGVPDEQAAKRTLARAVHIGFMDQLKAMHADLDDLRSKAKTIQPGTISKRLSEFKELSKRAETYADMLGMQQEALQEQLSQLRAKARALILSDELPDTDEAPTVTETRVSVAAAVGAMTTHELEEP